MAEGQTTAAAEQVAQPFLPADPLAARAVTYLREHFASDILDMTEHRGQTSVVLRPAAIEAVCRGLRDDQGFGFLSQITAVDWPEREPRYDIVYHLLALDTRATLRLKVRVGDDDTPNPETPTVTTVWPAANWFEREVYDLFGIQFTGHPDLTRILMPPDWVGHPLRKDYPLSGFQLPAPHWGGQIPFDQPLPAGTGAQTLRTPDGLEEAPLAGNPPPNKLDGE